MGYALFTARKLSLTTRLNLCNAQLMSNSERANALTQSIYAARTKSATEANKLTTEAYKTYTSSLKSANDIYKAVLDNEASTEEAKEDAIKKEQGEFILELIREHNFEKYVEIQRKRSNEKCLKTMN